MDQRIINQIDQAFKQGNTICLENEGMTDA